MFTQEGVRAMSALEEVVRRNAEPMERTIAKSVIVLARELMQEIDDLETQIRRSRL